MPEYQVIVGNIGTVYCGPSEQEAVLCYRDYRTLVQGDYGREAGEPVFLMLDGSLEEEYYPENRKLYKENKTDDSK